MINSSIKEASSEERRTASKMFKRSENLSKSYLMNNLNDINGQLQDFNNLMSTSDKRFPSGLT
jgi:hypothetical protein